MSSPAPRGRDTATTLVDEPQSATEPFTAAREYTRTLIETGPDPFVTMSPVGRITDCNEAAVRITGVSRDQLLGSYLFEYFTDPEQARGAHGVALADGLVANYPLTLRRADGAFTDVLYSSAVHKDAAGAVTGALTAVRIVGEQKKVEQLEREIVHRLGELDAAKTDFVARVSHELRSPLTSLVGYLELLEEGDVGALNGEQRRMLEIMDRNTHRLLNLVEDLLTTERVDAGSFRVDATRVPLAAIVDRVMELFASEIHGHGLRCAASIEPGIELDADSDELGRMLANLLSNSIKFTRSGGQIRIAAYTEVGQAIVTVRDTGIGIPVDEQPRLFTRFFRSTISEKLETQGVGLGLFIVKQIVEAHGGTVAVASTPGEGTAVTVRLPLRRP